MGTKVADLTIRRVGHAARCEICHQDDLFNAETGECARCRGILIPPALALNDGALPIFPILQPSRTGRILNFLAAIGATLLGIPAGYCAAGVINTAITELVILSYRGTSSSGKDELILLWGLAIPIVGVALLLYFWIAVDRPFASRTRIAAWAISLLFAGSALFLLPRFFSYVSSGMGIAWLVGSFVMTLISITALVEEIIHRSRHAND